MVFGGSGNLTARKIVPAFHPFHIQGRLPKNFCIIAAGRSELTSGMLRKKLKGPRRFLEKVHYCRIGSYDTAGCKELKKSIAGLTGCSLQENNYLFYLAVPSQNFVPIARGLKESNWVWDPDRSYWTRLVVEKPFSVTFNMSQGA